MKKILLILIFSPNFLFSQNNEHDKELSTTIGVAKIFVSSSYYTPNEYTPMFLSANFKYYLNDKIATNFKINEETFFDFNTAISAFYSSTNIFFSYDFLHFKKIKFSFGLGGTFSFQFLSYYSNTFNHLDYGLLSLGLVSNIDFYYFLNDKTFVKFITDYEMNLPNNNTNLRFGISYGIKF